MQLINVITYITVAVYNTKKFEIWNFFIIWFLKKYFAWFDLLKNIAGEKESTTQNSIFFSVACYQNTIRKCSYTLLMCIGFANKIFLLLILLLFFCYTFFESTIEEVGEGGQTVILVVERKQMRRVILKLITSLSFLNGKRKICSLNWDSIM